MRLLYLMHVDWRWIKQRPHFIAEGLSADLELVVLYIPAMRRRWLTRNESHVRRIPLPIVAGARYSVLHSLNIAAGRSVVGALAAWWKPDALWLTAPEMYEFVPRAVRRQPLIYDAMDVASALGPRPDRRAQSEARVLERASIVFATTDHIAQGLRTACEPVIVPNGFDGRMLDPSPGRPAGTFRLGYVGTIAEWLDAEALLLALDRHPCLEVHLVGPLSGGVRVPRHPRLRIHKPVDHAVLPTVGRTFNATILPFVLTEATLGVDPIKLYEYLAWRRPVISIRYPAVERYAGFVNFYDRPEDLSRVVGEIMSAPQDFVPDHEATVALLEQGTWNARLAAIRRTLRDRLGPASGDIEVYRGTCRD